MGVVAEHFGYGAFDAISGSGNAVGGGEAASSGGAAGGAAASVATSSTVDDY